MKKILYFLLLLCVSFAALGQSDPRHPTSGTKVIGGIIPNSPIDTYGTGYSYYEQGGFTVATTIANRDSISPERRIDKMVYVRANGITYLYNSGTSAWDIFTFGGGSTLVPTTVKTANYTATANDFVLYNTTSGSLVNTLPAAPADKTQIGVKMITQGGTNTVTISTSGSDVINKTGGSTSIIIKLNNEGIVFQYAAAAGIWYITSHDLPLAGLDNRYMQPGNNLSDLTSAATARTNLGLSTVAASGLYSDISGRPTDLSSFTNGPGYLTAITSSQITTALGYTPYNGATNPNGYISSITGISAGGDLTGTYPNPTLATVNSNVGSFGSSTAIPSFTVNGKGLITAVSTTAVIAPASTLSGTTLNSTVVNSSLTSLGILTSLNISGSLALGGTASTANAILIGTSNISISSGGIGRAFYFNGVLRATADNDVLYAADLTNGSIDVATGATSIASYTITNPGSGYVNGTYTFVPLTGGAGTGAVANITVAGGVVTVAIVSNPTSSAQNTSVGYAIGNTLSVSNTNLGGSGSGLVLTVASVTFRGVSRNDLRVNNMVPSVSLGGNIGNSTLPYSSVVANLAQISAISMRSTTFNLLDQGSSAILTTNTGIGNFILDRGGSQTDAGYRLTLGSSSNGANGSLFTRGAISAVSNIGRGVYINNSLNSVNNNDVTVGLDISNSVSLGTTAIQALGTVTGGSGYTNGTTLNVPLTGGTGTGATATIIVSGGAVTSAVITATSRGTGYTAGDVLSMSASPGSGFSVPVSSIGLTGVISYSLRTSGSVLFNGNLNLGTVGSKINITTGTNAIVGTGTITSGTATINNTSITASSKVFLTRAGAAGTGLGFLTTTGLVAGTSFTVTSFNALNVTETNDNSSFYYWIIN